MPDELAAASTSDRLVHHQHHTPRRRERDRQLVSPAVSPLSTPAASPERTRRDDTIPRASAAAAAPQQWPAPITAAIATTGPPVASSSQHSYLNRARGHQFTVGNVSNGMIYLRPVARPAHELHHNFGLPSTPPSSVEDRQDLRHGRDEIAASAASRRDYGAPRRQGTSPPRTPVHGGPRQGDTAAYLNSSPPIPRTRPRTRHKRSHSCTTIGEHGAASVRDQEFGKFQLRVDQFDGPTEDRARPQTADAPESFQSLNVQIPHYHLGSPRFSPNGTPFLFGSSSVHAPSTRGELGTPSVLSHTDVRWLWPGADPRSVTPSRLSPGISSPIPIMEPPQAPSPLYQSSSSPTGQLVPSPPPRDPTLPSISSPSLYIPSFPVSSIVPEIYDRLSFPPTSEHPSVVRYDARSQEIVAAIPPRIVAQITSAAFVDYHLLSDFFLTYRLFMSCSHLSAYLIARLRWAIDRGDDTGKVVRVRTFVAIRHWLLNYFADDFVPSLPFRQEFTNALNDLTNSVRKRGNASDLKILGELKKCWRRTCALYWDDEEYGDAGLDQDISPGGTPGRRKDSTRPQSMLVKIQKMTPPPRLGSVGPERVSESGTFLRDVVEPLRIVKAAERVEEARSSIGRSSSVRTKSIPSVLSDQKFDVSVRSKSPARASSPILHVKGGSSASSRMMTSARKGRPGIHKRSGSFSDALRDNRQPLPLPNSLAKSAQLFMALPYAGSLVRGNLFPPTPAFVEVIAPSTPLQELESLQLIGSKSTDKSAVVSTTEKNSVNGAKPHTPVKKRILGGMRRALSVKTQNSNMPPNGSKPLTPTGVARVDSLRSYTSAQAKQERDRRQSDMGLFGDGQLGRIDLLGAGAVAAFQKAMEDVIYPRMDGAAVSTSGYGNSSAGQEYDGAADNHSDAPTDRREELREGHGSEGGSAEELVYDMRSGDDRGTPQTQDTEGFLASPSPSTLNPQPNEDAFMKGEISFLFDGSEAVSSRNSIEPSQKGDSISLARVTSNASSQFPRRSKSFSFERTPARFHRPEGTIDEHLAVITSEPGKSLYSAQSFSLKRATSALSMQSITDSYNDASSIASSRFEAPAPKGLLRRRPGGDLRAANTVGDLDQHPRPKSDSSVTTGVFSLEDAIRSAPYHRALSPNDLRHFSKPSASNPVAAGVISLGAVAKGGHLSLPPAAPSPPRLSPSPVVEPDPKASFEAGVQRLRELPDDESDDGGVEVALAKLEGTYQRKKSGESSPVASHCNRDTADFASRDFGSSLVMVDTEPDKRTTAGYDGSYDGAHDSYDENEAPDEAYRRLRRRHKQVLDHEPLQTPPIMDGAKASARKQAGGSKLTKEESEDSLPIIERSISNFNTQPLPKALRKSPAVSNFRSSAASSRSERPYVRSMPPSAVDLLRVDSQLEQVLSERSTKRFTISSELSSEISYEIVSSGGAEGESVNFPPVNASTIISELGLPSHPLRHPPSPPLTLEKTLTQNLSNTANTAKPQTPYSATKVASPAAETFTTQATYSTAAPKRSTSVREDQLRPTAVHLPFILAYDSELLARQFTLIEKDALLEVDWKELVELSWSQNDANVRDWVELLNSKDIKGVEVVIARFNLMCKWARSEIVMTRSLDERARTIIKLIHVAAHARRMQNYTTMYQLTIALLTADITRLRGTWARIPPADLVTFRELESLVQPVRNFHNLRMEMEKVTGESGCIPFVGLFTHDLILNAQRPAVISVDSNVEPLVNFERHRTTAAIVKRLLRLIEASHKYSFEAVDGVCERCLWIAALSDHEISALSRNLE